MLNRHGQSLTNAGREIIQASQEEAFDVLVKIMDDVACEEIDTNVFSSIVKTDLPSGTGTAQGLDVSSDKITPTSGSEEIQPEASIVETSKVESKNF